MHRTRYIRRASGGAVAAIGVHGQGCSVHRSWFIGMRHGDFSNGCGSYVNARCKLTGKHFAGFIYREMAATWNGDDVNLQRRTPSRPPAPCPSRPCAIALCIIPLLMSAVSLFTLPMPRWPYGYEEGRLAGSAGL